MELSRKNLIPIILILAGSLFVFNCEFIFADNNRPEEGSIQFGAGETPELDSPKELEAFKTIFVDVAEKVVPSVVSVIPTKIDTVMFYKNPFYKFFNGPSPRGNDPFNFFFRRPDSKQQEPQVEKKERRKKGLGSGVIVSENGYILTNYHVVKGADEIDIKLNDGRQFEAEIIGADSLSDVAVVKIKEDVDDLPVVYIGNSDKLKPGSWVVAIGNPFSLTSTVTSGIVSALGRNISGGNKYQNFIQTDAAINPGNSGGALVNIEGELVGVNTMIFSRTGGYMGIGFAIPINMAKRIMEDLIYHGKVERGWIGVTIQDIDGATRDALDLGEKKGVLISDVYENDPADKAGIKQGDIILTIDGVKVATANQLRNLVATLKPGKKVSIKVIREGKEKKLTLKVGERDEKQISKLSGKEKEELPEKKKEKMKEKLGISVSNLTSEVREKYGIDRAKQGVVIVNVDRKFHYSKGAIKEGDVIRQVKTSGSDFTEVKNVKEFEKAVRGVDKGDSVMLLIQRNGRLFFTAFKAEG